VIRLASPEPLRASRVAATLLGAAMVVLGLAALVGACGASQQVGYGAANGDCASQATTFDQAERCVDILEALYCGDGGLWTHQDGGPCYAKDGGK
jgi:hypothetical protein